jgi:hypothetical protein
MRTRPDIQSRPLFDALEQERKEVANIVSIRGYVVIWLSISLTLLDDTGDLRFTFDHGVWRQRHQSQQHTILAPYFHRQDKRPSIMSSFVL